MKIGLLQCDHVDDELVGEHGEYPDMIQRAFHLYLPEQSSAQIKWHRYAVIDDRFPEYEKECDAYIITGSKHNVDDPEDWIVVLKNFVGSCYIKGIPVIGICFGHQLIASALGGEVKPSKNGWGVGIYKSDIQHHLTWMDEFSDHLTLIYSHQDQVQKVPANTKTLVSNEFCRYGMILIGEHFLGIQGHPEFEKSYSRDLMNLRSENIPHTTRMNGLSSLQQDHEASRVILWMFQFLKQQLRP